MGHAVAESPILCSDAPVLVLACASSRSIVIDSSDPRLFSPNECTSSTMIDRV